MKIAMRAILQIIKIFFILLMFNSCEKNKKIENTDLKPVSDSLYFENYSNGKIKIRAEIKNKSFNGKYKIYNKEEKVVVEGLMKDGNKIGFWKYYDEKGELTNVKRVINDSLEFDMEISDFKTKKVDIKKYLFSINVPQNWDTNTLFKQEEVIISSRKKCEKNRFFCPNISVVIDYLPDSLSLKKYVDKTVPFLSENYEGFQNKGIRETKIDGREAYKLLYYIAPRKNVIGGSVTYINNGGTILVVTSMAQNDKEHKDFLKYRLIFDEIINSISFLASN